MNRCLWIAAACLCACLMPLAAGLAWKEKAGSMRPVWMGVLGFFAFAAIAEMFFVMLALSALGPVSAFLNASAARLIVFSCLCAGIFEECGRYTVYRTGLADCEGRAVPLGYAIGHFGAEIIILTVYPLLAHAPESFGVAQCTVTLYERLIACCGHTALSVLVWVAFCEKKQSLLVLAIIVHAVCDAPLGMLRYGLLTDFAAEALFGIFIIFLCILAIACWRRMPAGDIIKKNGIEKGVET